MVAAAVFIRDLMGVAGLEQERELGWVGAESLGGCSVVEMGKYAKEDEGEVVVHVCSHPDT